MPEKTNANLGLSNEWDGVWIAIPAYNEARTIRELAHRSLELCPRVIVVDDGSTDATADELRGLPVTLLQRPRNEGKAGCLRLAFSEARRQGAQCVITLDGDGQHDPNDAPALLRAWRRHPDRMILGARLHDKAQFPVARYCANRCACFWISWAAGYAIADSQTGFRIYPAAVLAIATSANVRGDRFTFESEILIEAADHGIRALAVAIPGRYPPNARPSHFRPVVDVADIVAMVGMRLLKKGLHPRGLWHSLQPAPILSREEGNG
jgi:glycosyltransferase involved in cell wall biosynthesis